MMTSPLRIAEIQRQTRETNITVKLLLDGTGQSQIRTGIGFLDHLLDALTRHSRFDLELSCAGDLEVDDHHSVEDCGLAIGAAIDKALDDRAGINRFGWAYAPLDEALSRAVVDLSGRPFSRLSLGLRRERLGSLSCENIAHFLSSLASAAKLTLHVEVLQGENDHHRAESAIKAVALALRHAAARDGSNQIPSTKGILT